MAPGLYILTRTRQESDLLLLFCTQFFETWGLESCKRYSSAMSRCPYLFFPSGQPLYRQVLRTWIQMMMNSLMNWMKARIYRRYTEDAYTSTFQGGCQLVKTQRDGELTSPEKPFNLIPMEGPGMFFVFILDMFSLFVYHTTSCSNDKQTLLVT